MTKSKDLTEISTVIEIEPNALELKPGIVMTNLNISSTACVHVYLCVEFMLWKEKYWPKFNWYVLNIPIRCCFVVVKPATDDGETIETRSTADERSTDETDQGCTNCSSIETAKSKERVSLSSSSDDETEQAISLTMNKKSTIAYKGKYIYCFGDWNKNKKKQK